MSNDPKDTVVDWSKLAKTTQDNQNILPSNSAPEAAPQMITALNEGTKKEDVKPKEKPN